METDTISNAAEKQYLAKFDELNVISARFSAGGFTKQEARQRFDDILIQAYIMGSTSAAYILGDETMKPNHEKANAMTEKRYGEASIGQKFDEYYDSGDEGRLNTLLQSEFHRAYSEGGYDTATAYAEQHGVTVYKQWITMRDDKVRDTHFGIDGVRIPMDEYYVTDDGDSALVPGGFSDISNNANCRCYLRYDAE